MWPSQIAAMFAITCIVATCCLAGHLQAESSQKELEKYFYTDSREVIESEFTFPIKLISGQPVVEVKIGTPGQQFKMMLDTFGSITWLCSSSSNTIECEKHDKYSNPRSSTYKPNGTTVSMLIGTGTLEGFRSIDNIELNGLIVEDQTIVELNKTNAAWFASANYDGFLGLGYNLHSLVGGLYDYQVPSFSTWFSKDKPELGELALAGVDETKYTGELSLARVVPRAETWMFEVQSIAGKKSDLPVCKNGCHALIQTGSPIIIGPKDEVAKLNENLGAKKQHDGRYAFPSCDTINAIPSLVFQISNKTLELPAENFVAKQQIEGNWACMSLLEGSSSSIWHLGMPFVKHHYILYSLRGFLAIATSK